MCHCCTYTTNNIIVIIVIIKNPENVGTLLMFVKSCTYKSKVTGPNGLTFFLEGSGGCELIRCELIP